jgi:hypothetical protein
MIPELVNASALTPADNKWGGTVTDMTISIKSTKLDIIKEFISDIIEYDEDGDTGLTVMDQKWLLLLLRNS